MFHAAAACAMVVPAMYASAASARVSCFVCTDELKKRGRNWGYEEGLKNLEHDVWLSLWGNMVLSEAPGPEREDCVEVVVGILEPEGCSALLTADRMQDENNTIREEAQQMPDGTPEERAAKFAKNVDYMRLWPAVSALRAWERQKGYEGLEEAVEEARSSNSTHFQMLLNVRDAIQAAREGSAVTQSSDLASPQGEGASADVGPHVYHNDSDASNGTSSTADMEAGAEASPVTQPSDMSSPTSEGSSSDVRPHSDRGEPVVSGDTSRRADMEAATAPQVIPQNHVASYDNAEGSGSMASHADMEPTELQVQPAAMQSSPHEFLQWQPKSRARAQLTMAAFMVCVLARLF